MMPEYNPFAKKQDVETTTHGIINRKHDMGCIYLTHRHNLINAENKIMKEFNLKGEKTKGFAITNSEIEMIQNNRVKFVIIMLHDNIHGISIPYRIRTSEISKLPNYQERNIANKFFEINKMEQIGV